MLLEAFHINYSFCFNTSLRHHIQLNSSFRPAGSVLSLQSTCQIFTGFVYSDVHYSKNMRFQLCFRLQCGAAPTLLMTPAPCNFFSVANSDYRVGVELRAQHHLFQLLFCVCSVFNTGPAAVRLNSRVNEAVFNTQSDLVQRVSPRHSPWLLIFNASFAQHAGKLNKRCVEKWGETAGADWCSLMENCPAASVPRRVMKTLVSCQISLSLHTFRWKSTTENVV